MPHLTVHVLEPELTRRAHGTRRCPEGDPPIRLFGRDLVVRGNAATARSLDPLAVAGGYETRH